VSEALYERYKEALRRGHVAALRSRPDEAIVAYHEAAAIAPERALPHASLGVVLLRLGRLPEALDAYTAALERAPRDEAALLGRAEALALLERRVEAAESLDRAAEVQAADGRPVEALDTARRALELAESKSRRRHVEVLAAGLAAVRSDPEAELAVERARQVLEASELLTGLEEAPAGTMDEAAVDAAAEPPPDPIALTIAADRALEAGDAVRARDDFLAAARAHAGADHRDAALDACYRALAAAPGDPEIHLELVDLYLARGWHGLAGDKLALLARLVELDGDPATGDRIRSIVAGSFADDPRLASLVG
jgi:tetratricopeptide (TPR) repeat protein